MVPDAYDECAKCGRFHYAHGSQELSRRERHAFTPREDGLVEHDTRTRIEAETVAKIVEMLRSEARALRAAKAKSFEDAARVTLVAFADRLEREWKRGT